MKILVNGKDREFEKECMECRTLLKYGLEDVFKLEETNAKYESNYIVCPVCKNEITIKVIRN